MITPQQSQVTQSLIQQLMKDANLTYAQVSDALNIEVGSSLSSLAGPYSYMVSHPLGDTAITAMKNGTTGAWNWWSTNASQVYANVLGNITQGTIFTTVGVYNLNGSIIVNGKNSLHLAFEKGASLFVSNGMSAAAIFLTNSRNILIDGVTIDGNAVNQVLSDHGGASNEQDGILVGPVCSNIHVDDVNITNVRLIGFRVGNVPSPESGSIHNGITNSNISYCGWNGIGFSPNSTGSYVENNVVSYASDVGISTYAPETTIRDNIVFNITGGTTSGSNNASVGIMVEGGFNDLITGNTVKNASTGIIIAALAPNCTVSENTVSNMTAGLVTLTGNNTSVKDNRLTSVLTNGQSAIYITAGSDHNTIKGNYISFANASGIAMNSNNNSITDNFIWDNGKGIYVVGNNSLISGNTCYDDRAGTARTQYYNIIVESKATNNQIMGNYLSNSISSRGVYDANWLPNSFINNQGYNPQGYMSTPICNGTSFNYLVDVAAGNSSVWVSAATYVAWQSPKAVYVYNATAITVDGQALTVAALATVTLILQPGDSFIPTFQGASGTNCKIYVFGQ